MRDKNKALEGIEQSASEVGRNILQTPLDTILNSYQATMNEFSQADPISILPDRTVPLIDTSIVMAHNAYNSLSSGAIWPNQQLSLTELLDIGVRGLELDVHWDKGTIRLCHELCLPEFPGVSIGYNRPLSEALTEVQKWLTNHTSETVILKFEDYLDPVKTGAPVRELARVLQENLNTSSIFTPTSLTQTFNGNWPSIDQMNAMGKQLILMPQNSGQNQALFFDGNWGRRFKNTYNTGTIARVRPNNLTISRSLGTKLIEVGEDRTFIGTLVDTARKIPFLDRLIPHDLVASQMTKEEIQQLRANGVNLISLDNIERNDARLTPSMTLSDLRNNAYVFIPVAIAAAALTSRDKEDKLLSTTAKRSFIQLLVASTLPDEGRILYNSVDSGISAYNESTELARRADRVMTTLDQARAVSHSLVSGMGKGAETVARIGLSNVTGQSISNSITSAPTLLSTVGKIASNFIVTKIILDPPIGVIKGAYQGFTRSDQPPGIWSRTKSVFSGAMDGFVRGIESSMFGLVKFDDPNEPRIDSSIDELTDRMENLSLGNNLKRSEKTFLTKETGAVFNLKETILQYNSHQEKVIKEIMGLSKLTTKTDVEEILPGISVKDSGKIMFIPEEDHIKEHGSNIDKIIKQIESRTREENAREVIFLERKEEGENLGMSDVILLANIIKYNETNKEKIILPQGIEATPIYQDAKLYNIAKENGIRVIGAEGKGLKHSKESPLYNQERVEYMVERFTTMIEQGYNITMPVGTNHIQSLEQALVQSNTSKREEHVDKVIVGKFTSKVVEEKTKSSLQQNLLHK